MELLDALRARLRGALYIGPIASEDGWGATTVSSSPRSCRRRLRRSTSRPSISITKARARRLVALLADAHAHGEPLGTLRPESVQLAPGGDRWLGSGERLWSFARPLSVGTLSPYAPGYGAPETQAGWPLLAPFAASADVLASSAIVAEKLLGTFPIHAIRTWASCAHS